MGEPRAENCREYAERAGKVVGVALSYLPNPAARYELVDVALLDEEHGGGNTIARVFVEDVAAQAVPGARVGLCYPWAGWEPGQRFANVDWPGGPGYPFQHMISNHYDAPALGPLAIAILDANGSVISDVIGGLGLPGAHHISFQMTFRERPAADGGGETGGDDDGDQGDTDDVTTLLREILAVVTKIARYLGVAG